MIRQGRKMKKSLQTVLLAISVISALPQMALAQDEVSDPLESLNRAIFSFNNTVDDYLLAPASRGYDTLMPERAQKGVNNFFDNLGYPKYLLSDLVQLKFGQALTHTGRFLINSTVGIAGLLDVANDMGLEREEEDFGIALAYHGIPSGAYLVLPFMGPSNLRDTVGRVVDTLVHPLALLNYSDVRAGIADRVTISAQTIDTLQTRVNLDEAIKAGKESAVDYYLFVQGAYTQFRRGVLYDGNPPEEESEDLSATPE